MRSQGAGRTWESVSQFGSAAFHAISVVGVLVVAALYGQGDILVSRDAGKRFKSRVAPMALVDVASSRRTRATGWRPSSRASTSPPEEGRAWRERDPTPNVRLAWASARELFRIDPGGPVKVSADGGAAGRTAELSAASLRR